MKEWRSHWKWRKFLNALFLGLAVSLFDSVTDFNFAWSVPQDCRNTNNSSVKPFDEVYVSSPCGLLYYKNVERLTFTYIAYPGFFFAFDDLDSLVWGLITKCRGEEAEGKIRQLGHFLALEVFLAVALLVAAMWSHLWENDLPQVELGYDFLIQGMSYLSFAIVVGVKCLGIFSHGPETYNLRISTSTFSGRKNILLFRLRNLGQCSFCGQFSCLHRQCAGSNIPEEAQGESLESFYPGENLRCDLDSSRLRPLRHFQAWLDHFGSPLERHPLCREYSFGNWASCPRFLHHGDPYQRPGGS